VAGRLPIKMRPSRGGLGAIGAGLALAIGSGTSLAAEAGTRGAKTTRVSVSSHEAQANGRALAPAISANGRFVAFESEASNLIRHDTNGAWDVFVRDRKRGTTRRVSISSKGKQANSGHFGSIMPAISADGRFVAFASKARNLVARPSSGHYKIFVHDRQSGKTRLVSVSSTGAPANMGSYDPVISAHGRFVAFRSRADNLVERDMDRLIDIFVHDRKTGRTRRVSVSSSGEQANSRRDGAGAPAMSANGRFVVFISGASSLVTGDTNGRHDIFVHDRVTAETTRVSVSSNGAQADRDSALPSTSANGRFVAFVSDARNLVAEDTNRDSDVFVHDRVTGETTRVSVSSKGAQADRDSAAPLISANGRFVTFYSRATLAADDTNGRTDAFVHDRSTGETTVVSVASSGAPAHRSTFSVRDSPAISASGRFVAFQSNAGNLVRRDTNGEYDIFVRGPLR